MIRETFFRNHFRIVVGIGAEYSTEIETTNLNWSIFSYRKEETVNNIVNSIPILTWWLWLGLVGHILMMWRLSQYLKVINDYQVLDFVLGHVYWSKCVLRNNLYLNIVESIEQPRLYPLPCLKFFLWEELTFMVPWYRWKLTWTLNSLVRNWI